MRPSYKRLFILLLSALFLFTADRHAAAQSGHPQQQQRSADKDDKDDADENEPARPRVADPAAVMRAARTVYVKSDTVFVKQAEVEDSLRKRKEFRAWGMSVTRNLNDADLVIEIERKSLTRRFTFIVLEPRTMTVVTSGKTRSVLFGKKIPNKIAEKFANRVKTVRPYPPVAPNP